MPIEIIPSSPSSDNSIELVFSGAYCVDSTSRERLGTDFQFTINLSEICLAPPPIYSESWNVGRLMPGEYTASANFSNGIVESQAFTVSQGALPFTTAIPTLGVSGVALLALAVVLIANKSLQRTRVKAGR